MSKSYKKNIAYNSIYRIVVIIAPLITSPYISRVLGATNIGIYTYCNSLTLYYVIFAMLGVNDYGNRSIAKCKEGKKELSETFWQIYYLQMFLSIVSLIAYIITVIWIKNDYAIVRIILIAYVVTCFLEINWFAFGLQEFKFTSIRNIIFRIGIVICTFVFVKNEKDISKYTAIMIFGNLLSTIPVWFLVKKYTYFQKPNFKKIMSHLKPNLILFLPVVATTVYQQIDKLMLGNASLTSEVGYYQNAENIINLPSFLTNAIVTVMLPYISNMLANGKEAESIGLLKKSIHYASILNIAMTFGMIAIADTFIPWYLGRGYERSAELVIVLAPIVFIGGLSSIIRYEYLIPHEMDKVFSISIILGAVINVVLNSILIPYMQADGAAIATFISYLIVLVYQIIFSYKYVQYKDCWIKMLPYFVLGGLMYGALYAVKNTLPSSMIIRILVMLLIGFVIWSMGTIIIMKVSNDPIIDVIKSKFKNRMRGKLDGTDNS